MYIIALCVSSQQVSGTGNGPNNVIRVFSAEVIAGTPPDPLTVVMRGGEESCYGALVLPVESLGTAYYTICAGYNQPGEISQVLCCCYVAYTRRAVVFACLRCR